MKPTPPPLAARWPEGCLYLGSFSKVLAPGLRLGYVVAPRGVYPKRLQAKQAADLHTPGFNPNCSLGFGGQADAAASQFGPD